MVQATLWNHRHGDDRPTIAIYVGLARAFRKEGSTLAEALAKVRAELVARYGERACDGPHDRRAARQRDRIPAEVLSAALP